MCAVCSQPFTQLPEQQMTQEMSWYSIQKKDEYFQKKNTLAEPRDFHGERYFFERTFIPFGDSRIFYHFVQPSQPFSRWAWWLFLGETPADKPVITVGDGGTGGRGLPSWHVFIGTQPLLHNSHKQRGLIIEAICHVRVIIDGREPQRRGGRLSICRLRASVRAGPRKQPAKCPANQRGWTAAKSWVFH